jgi:uncharacterized protein with beta-barrel porin domain
MNIVEVIYDAQDKAAYEADAFAVGMMGQIVGAAIKNITYNAGLSAGFVEFEMGSVEKAHELAKSAAASEITIFAKVTTTTTYNGKFNENHV